MSSCGGVNANANVNLMGDEFHAIYPCNIIHRENLHYIFCSISKISDYESIN